MLGTQLFVKCGQVNMLLEAPYGPRDAEAWVLGRRAEVVFRCREQRPVSLWVAHWKGMARVMGGSAWPRLWSSDVVFLCFCFLLRPDDLHSAFRLSFPVAHHPALVWPCCLSNVYKPDEAGCRALPNLKIISYQEEMIIGMNYLY